MRLPTICAIFVIVPAIVAFAQTISTVPGPITVMGVPGEPGPPGPKGNMARGTPAKGSTCTDGDSFYDYDNPAAPTKRFTWTCAPGGKWFQDKSAAAVVPW